jgi:hypothetical protein
VNLLGAMHMHCRCRCRCMCGRIQVRVFSFQYDRCCGTYWLAVLREPIIDVPLLDDLISSALAGVRLLAFRPIPCPLCNLWMQCEVRVICAGAGADAHARRLRVRLLGSPAGARLTSHIFPVRPPHRSSIIAGLLDKTWHDWGKAADQ